MKFSIIIPTFNSEKYINACLNSVFNLDYSKDKFEVIVVDGGSKDKTLEIVKKYSAKIIYSKNISISNSRNVATKSAKGNIFVFIDSDCVADKNLLSIAFKFMKKYSCFGSFYKASKKASWIAKSWLKIEQKKKGFVDWVPAGTLAIKKSLFLDVDGFNEQLKTGEDVDICYRIRKKGHKIFNAPSIASVHLGQTDNLKEFFKKEMWRGNSLIQGIKEHGLGKEELPSTVLTFYHFVALLFFIISLFIGANFILLSLILLLAPSLLLALRKVLQTGKIKYFFAFYTLILVYQLARAISLVRYNQFKDLF